MSKVLKFSATMIIIMLIILFIFHQTKNISRLQTGWTMLIYVFTDWLLRALNKKRIFYNNVNKSNKSLSVIIISPGNLADDLMEKFKKQQNDDQRHVTAIILADNDTCSVKGDYDIPVMMSDQNAVKYVQNEWVDEIFYLQSDETDLNNELLNSFIDMGITVHICPLNFNDSDIPFNEINTIGKYTVLTSRLRSVQFGQVAIKRLMDVIGGILGCTLTFCIMIVIGPLIYFNSPGPIFFAQERVGKNGRRFRMYKFRSMYMDAEKRKAELMEQNRIDSDLMFKMDDDPRIIGSEKKDSQGRPCGIGNFIRNTSLDEFPQFWNVLKGDMSLVGTRPPLPEEWEKYNPHHRARMAMKPGITGMWQVSGRSNITDFEEVVRLDLEYIETWDIKLDVKILLKTIAMMTGRKHE